MITSDMIEAVKTYAQEHYSEGGWDVIVECYEDEEIRHALEVHEQFDTAISTDAEAIQAIGQIVDIMNEQQKESWAEGGLCIHCASPDHESTKCPKEA